VSSEEVCGQAFEEGHGPGPARDQAADKRNCLDELNALHDKWTGEGPIRSRQVMSLLGYLVEKGVVTPDE